MKSLLEHKKAIFVAAIGIITFICFRYTLNNQFTNWDDDYYVTHDKWIQALTPHNIWVIFTHDITKNNYHPFCMLSLAINYFFAQLNPMTYYLTNVLIHCANAMLVFLLFFQICRRLNIDEFGTFFISGLGGLWFGIHPMHVESVGWIAERKDVLYALFYILGLMAYVRYIFETENKTKWYWVCFLLFVASCLSKPMAVMFPIALFCMDILFKRQWDKKLVTEKAIFLFTSLVCGAAAFYTQHKTGAIAEFGKLTVPERVMYASYSFVMYTWKFFSPTYLSTFYPYPFRFITGYLHPFFYMAPFITIAILTLPVWIAYRKNKEYFRVVAFGIGFFFANVVFVLQFISVGAAIMADRYSYVSYIGLLFLVPYLLYQIIKRNDTLRTPFIIMLSFLSALLAYACYERTFVWHDAETLLSDAVEKYPVDKRGKPHDPINSGIAFLSYKWLGNYYLDKGDPDKALENYNVLTMLHADDKFVLRNIDRANAMKVEMGLYGGNTGTPAPGASGVVPGQPGVPGGTDMRGGMMPANQQPQAPLNSADFLQHINKSIYLCATGDSLAAFREYINALRLNRGAENVMADSCFRFVQTGRFVPVANMYGILLKLNTSNPFYYFYRGVAEFSTGKMHPAIADWEVGVKMNSADVQKSASYNLAVALDSVGNDSLAVYYATMAKGLGYTVTDDFMTKLQAKKAKKHR